MHLAQLNIGVLRHQKGEPGGAEFFDNLERVNAIADRMPGFVWRLQDDGGDATAFRLRDDPALAVNLSVWSSAEALQAFVFQTVHVGFYRKRASWFVPMTTPHFVMWWIPEGHIPTLEEAADRLDRLTRDGSSAEAFGWEDLPNAKAMQAARCA
jgi:heme-degrading monooxygenase HmoA